MNRLLFSLSILLLIMSSANAQNYITRNGNVAFHSHTALEDVDAQNNEVVSLLNVATGQFDFKIAIKSFHFKKTAMEEHFGGENYMDAVKYPKAGFAGKVTNITTVDFAKDGVYKVNVQGKLTIKDVTKDVLAVGTITIKSGVVTANSVFTVKRKEYHVMGESFTQQKIGEDIQVTVNCQYEKH